jgi:hypothetical protein
MPPTELLTAPVIRSWGITTLLLVLKMAAVGVYTSILRIRRRVYATRIRLLA